MKIRRLVRENPNIWEIVMDDDLRTLRMSYKELKELWELLTFHFKEAQE